MSYELQIEGWVTLPLILATVVATFHRRVPLPLSLAAGLLGIAVCGYMALRHFCQDGWLSTTQVCPLFADSWFIDVDDEALEGPVRTAINVIVLYNLVVAFVDIVHGFLRDNRAVIIAGAFCGLTAVSAALAAPGLHVLIGEILGLVVGLGAITRRSIQQAFRRADGDG